MRYALNLTLETAWEKADPRRFSGEAITGLGELDDAPIEWRVVPSCSDYAVSNDGRVRRETQSRGTRAGHVMKPYLSNVGYFLVDFALGAKNIRSRRTVHSLVAEAFIGPRPEGLIVLHNDGIRTNNFPENLRYGTYADNSADSKRHGTVSRGPLHAACIKAGIHDYGDLPSQTTDTLNGLPVVIEDRPEQAHLGTRFRAHYRGYPNGLSGWASTESGAVADLAEADREEMEHRAGLAEWGDA